MQLVFRALRWMLYKVENWFLIISLAVATITICVHVLFRYLLRNPLLGTEEVVRYLQIAITFIGMAVVTRIGVHLDVSILESISKSEKTMQIRRVFVESIGLGLCCVLAYLGYKYLLVGFTAGRSSALSIPLVLPYSTLFIGFTISCVHHCARLVQAIQSIMSNTKSKEL